MDFSALTRFLREHSELPVQIPDGLAVRRRIVRAREALIRAGEPSDHAYVVQHGLLEVRAEEPAPHRLSWMSRGAWIGEIGVLTGETRNASVIAWRDSVVLEIDAPTTREMLVGSGADVAMLTRHLLSRGRRSVAPRPRPYALGVIPSGVDVSTLRAAATALPGVVVAEGAEWRAGEPAAIEALEEHAAGARILVMIADPAATPWTQMILRAADRVALVVAVEAMIAGPSSLERTLSLPHAARSLDVLLTRPANATISEASSQALRRRIDQEPYTLRPESVEDLVDYLRVLLDEHALPERLRRYELFAGLDDAALAQIQEEIQWRLAESGEALIEAGEAPDGIYLVDLGRLQASALDPHGKRVMLSESGEGDAVGETALLLRSKRTADVHATRDTRIGFLSIDAYDRLQTILPEIGNNVARIASRRALVPASARRTPAPSALALLRLEDDPRSELLVDRFVEALRDDLGRAVYLVTRATIERDVGVGAAELRPGQPGYRRLLSWLHRIAADHEVVIFACGAAEHEWARCCVRQADRVLLVAPASADPGLRALERELQASRTTPPTELVLLQDAAITVASGTRRWVSARPDVFVHHVRDTNRRDVAATARRVMGCAYGIAFAGASTRVPAHTGVARAFADLGIPIDIVAGTSSGSTVAANLALGRTPQEVLDLTSSLIGETRLRIWELQPPITALTSGKRFDGLFQRAVGDVDVEDLLLPCRLSVVDLLSHELLYLDRGPLWKAMRASCSVPLVYPPVTEGRRFLVDGGLISYIPINAILPRCQRGLAVMSNISDPEVWKTFEAIEPYGTHVSGWRALLDRILPWRKPKPVPKLEDILFLSMIVSNALSQDRIDQAATHPAVCHIYQPFSGYGMFDVTPEVARKFEALMHERACRELRARTEVGAPTGR